MSSGSTVFFFDFDIFSIEPISTGSPVEASIARRASPIPSILTFAGSIQSPLLAAIGLMHHHALREQPGKRLIDAGMSGLVHGASEEARIEQMQDRVLDAADVLVDGKPFIDDLAIGWRGLDPWIGETGEIPRRVDKSIHCVGLAPRRSGARRTFDVLPCRVTIERITRRFERHILGQASPASPFPVPGLRHISCNG